MAISSVGTYLPTVQDYLAHWTSVNAALPPTAPLTLKGGYTLAQFTADRNSLQTAVDAIIAAETLRETAAHERDTQKTVQRARLTRFRAAVLSALQGTRFEAALPTLPPRSGNETRTMAAFRQETDLWAQINGGGPIAGFTPPLTLGDGTTLATVNTELMALQTAYRNVDTADNALRLARKTRDDLLRPLLLRLKQYRAAVINTFGPGSAFTASLPRLSAAGSASTPAPPAPTP